MDLPPETTHATGRRVLIAGTLLKQSVSAKFFKNWRTRHIEVEPRRVSWRKDEMSPTLNDLTLDKTTSLISHFGCRLSLSTRGRTLQIEAPDHAALLWWHMALVRALVPLRARAFAKEASPSFIVDYTVQGC